MGCASQPKQPLPDWAKHDLVAKDVMLEFRTPKPKDEQLSEQEVDQAWIDRFQAEYRRSIENGHDSIPACILHLDVILHVKSVPPADVGFCFTCSVMEVRLPGRETFLAVFGSEDAKRLKALLGELAPKDSRFRTQ